MIQPFMAAAAQFEVGINKEANLEKTLHFIGEAAQKGADLVVLPEFLNHCSWYQDQAHCFEVSVALEDPFISAIKEKAKDHGLYVVANVTLRRDHGKVTGTSLLVDPSGGIISMTDKQVLIGHENDFLTASQKPSKVVDTALGRIGTYACMDGVLFETPRALALQGAQVLCNSLNSFARCEGDLHIPVRAAENKLFVVAANKVGPLIPVEQVKAVSKAINIPADALNGAGDSQVVGPDGSILAKADQSSEMVITAMVDPNLADAKHRPDGTSLFVHRRPELYKPITQAPQKVNSSLSKAAPEVEVAIYQPKFKDIRAIDEVVDIIKNAEDYSILTLPALFCIDSKTVEDLPKSKIVSDTAITEMTKALREKDGLLVASSLILEQERGYQHCGVMLDKNGVKAVQPQLHLPPAPKPALQPGLDLTVFETPFGKAALVVGQDTLYPETFRLAAIKGAHFVLSPFDAQESWELQYGLAERSAENRLCIVAASHETDFGASLFATLQADYTIMTKWENRPFDGNISAPILKRTKNKPGLYRGTIHPERSNNKLLSHRTHVVNSRPWHILDGMIS